MIKHVVIHQSDGVTVEQVIDRDTYSVRVTTTRPRVDQPSSITLDPFDARLLAVDLLTGALEPDTCPGTYDEGGCGDYIPCDTHGAP